MSKLVTIYGGSGFVGRYITQRMAKAGWRVRVAVRRPNEALFVKPYGAVGQVEPVACNVRDDASVAAAMQGADAVINCVGILAKAGKNTFDSIHVAGAERIARLAAQQGIARMVHISAIGADTGASSEYLRTKGAGEEAVLRHLPDATILRPSVIFGPEDNFFNRFGAMTRKGPFLPLVGAETKFQPVYVDDVAHAAELAATGAAASGVYELGGAKVASLRELMGLLLDEVYRRRIVIGLPFWVGGLIALAGDIVQGVTLGLLSNKVLTRDQLRSLKTDSVVSEGAKGFADLGIEPANLETVLPEYVWRFRPTGQYDDITRSARQLRP
ncbi:complex I NDUFA9 subunit family protein [Pseudodonghicola xiamenensis]|uniref:3-beta-hydroxy-Delta(5)-steroid dehydrogenase n=1 Tax=Pseudodonghicola xiamenensis TaxID=337702 RepID=A0A8J3H669_9RHOB|nr:complex I NDUFA9 subunit family protein [Pseudodonghicola xiamenensis]GHG83259.1 3-beta-hydroxy-Delta(5)-steroid dehydrogenase [Pseudodonghicola xiamenensis]